MKKCARPECKRLTPEKFCAGCALLSTLRKTAPLRDRTGTLPVGVADRPAPIEHRPIRPQDRQAHWRKPAAEFAGKEHHRRTYFNVRKRPSLLRRSNLVTVCRRLRLKLHMTQAELAQAAGVTQTDISLIECRDPVNPEKLQKVADFLGIDAEELHTVPYFSTR